MKVALLVVSGHNAGQVVRVSGPKFFIGRSEDCQLRPRSEAISRNHCVLLLERERVFARDLGSKNGTFVNDQRVRTEVELNNRDRLRVGDLEFEVRVETSIGGEKKPPVRSVHEAASRMTRAAQDAAVDEGKLDDWLSEGAGEPLSTNSTIISNRSQADDTISDDDIQESRGEGEAESPPRAESESSGESPESRQAAQLKRPSEKSTVADTTNAAAKALDQLLHKR